MDETSARDDFPGSRYGLPADGIGSVAGWGRRLLALVIDWVLSMFAVAAFVGADVWSGSGVGQWAPLAMFAVEVWLLTALLGSSAGQLITHVTIRRTSGALLDPGRVLIRTLLICLVLPPLVFNRDQQGLHDLAADSIAVRR